MADMTNTATPGAGLWDPSQVVTNPTGTMGQATARSDYMHNTANPNMLNGQQVYSPTSMGAAPPPAAPGVYGSGSVNLVNGQQISATQTTSNTPPAAVTNTSNDASGASTQHGLAPWIQPYVNGPQGYLTLAQQYVQDQLNTVYPGGGRPYEYAGQLVAGPSDLQTQAFQGIGGLTVPGGIGQAAQTAGNITNQLAQTGPYQGQNFSSGYNPQGYQSNFEVGTFDSGYNPERYNSTYNPERYQSNFQNGQFTSDYRAGTAGGQFQASDFSNVPGFDPSAISTREWDTQAAQQYMNPYLQQSLDPQLMQARRQADISRTADAARLAQAGAFGGSRQAIMEAEGNRNLERNLSDITGKGYFDAYNTGMQGFMTDQQRALEAARTNEQSRQFGAGFGLDIAKAGEQSRQFLTNSELQRYQMQQQAQQQQASLGLEAQKGTEQSKQFGATNALASYQANQQALQAAEGFRGDAYKMSEQAMQAKGQMTLEAQRAAEQSKQFGASQGLDAYRASQQALQAGGQLSLDAQRAAEQSNQFGAGYGLDSLKAALSGAQTQSQLGLASLNAQGSVLNSQLQAGDTQRAIQQSQNQAAYDEWLRRQEYPMEMAKFQQSMMSGLPVSAITQQQPQLGGLAQLVAGLAGAGLLTKDTNFKDLLNSFGIPGLADSIGGMFGGLTGSSEGDGGAAEQTPEAIASMYPPG